MNWGWKIFFVFLAFVGFVLFMVFNALKQDFNLVADNYYEKELKYQGEMEMIRNAKSLRERLNIEYRLAEQSVVLTYPTEQKDAIRGKIYFFRPSDSKEDREFIISPDEKGVQVIRVQSLKKGLWQVKVNWSYGATEYQDEKNLTIQ